MATNPWTQWLSALGKGQTSEAYKSWESWLQGQLDRMVRNEAFLGQMGRLMGDSFQVKAQMDRLVEQSLHNLRIPTLGDIEGIHKRLDGLERRLDDMERGGPDPRLDGIVERIEEVAGEVAEIRAALPKRRTRKKTTPDTD